MDDAVVAAIAPEVLLEGLIELLGQFLRKTTREQNDIRQDLVALQIDLGIIKDIIKIINNNLRNLDGLVAWREEASRLVTDAGTLLRRIEDQNDRPKSWWFNQERFHCNKDDTRELNELRRRCDNLTKHNETVLRLIEQYRHPFGWLFCGLCR